MDELTRSLIFALLLLLVLHVMGTFAYHYLEGWSWVDSVYFMSSTVTTVGYGDLVPETDEGKIFTVFFMWTGISLGFYLIFMISRYREAKIDTRLFSFMSLFSGKPKHKGLEGPPLDMHHESELRNMINPVHPIYPENSAPVAKKAPGPKKKSKK